MKYLKYIISLMCLIIAFMLWFNVPGLSDTRTILGTVFILLSNIFFNFKENNN